MIKIEGDFFCLFHKISDIGGSIIVGCQGNSQIIEVEDELVEVMDPHPYIEERVEKGAIPAPFNPHLMCNRLGHIRHDLHQPFGALFRNGRVLERTLNGNESQDEFRILIITKGLYINDLCKFFLRYIGQTCLMLLQYCDNLPDSFLPVPGPGFQILDFVGKVAEVEGEDEDNEEETKFEENAAEGESIFLWSGGMGWVFYLDDEFKCIHAYLLVLVKILRILI